MVDNPEAQAERQRDLQAIQSDIDDAMRRYRNRVNSNPGKAEYFRTFANTLQQIKQQVQTSDVGLNYDPVVIYNTASEFASDQTRDYRNSIRNYQQQLQQQEQSQVERRHQILQQTGIIIPNDFSGQRALEEAQRRIAIGGTTPTDAQRLFQQYRNQVISSGGTQGLLLNQSQLLLPSGQVVNASREDLQRTQEAITQSQTIRLNEPRLSGNELVKQAFREGRKKFGIVGGLFEAQQQGTTRILENVGFTEQNINKVVPFVSGEKLLGKNKFTEFTSGFEKGTLNVIRTKPLTLELSALAGFGIGGVIRGAGLIGEVVLPRTAQIIAQGGARLVGGGFVAVQGIQLTRGILQAPTFEEKGKVLGEILPGFVAFGLGATAGSRLIGKPFIRTPTRLITEENLYPKPQSFIEVSKPIVTPQGEYILGRQVSVYKTTSVLAELDSPGNRFLKNVLTKFKLNNLAMKFEPIVIETVPPKTFVSASAILSNKEGNIDFGLSIEKNLKRTPKTFYELTGGSREISAEALSKLSPIERDVLIRGFGKGGILAYNENLQTFESQVNARKLFRLHEKTTLQFMEEPGKGLIYSDLGKVKELNLKYPPLGKTITRQYGLTFVQEGVNVQGLKVTGEGFNIFQSKTASRDITFPRFRKGGSLFKSEGLTRIEKPLIIEEPKGLPRTFISEGGQQVLEPKQVSSRNVQKTIASLRTISGFQEKSLVSKGIRSSTRAFDYYKTSLAESEASRVSKLPLIVGGGGQGYSFFRGGEGTDVNEGRLSQAFNVPRPSTANLNQFDFKEKFITKPAFNIKGTNRFRFKEDQLGKFTSRLAQPSATTPAQTPFQVPGLGQPQAQVPAQGQIQLQTPGLLLGFSFRFPTPPTTPGFDYPRPPRIRTPPPTFGLPLFRLRGFGGKGLRARGGRQPSAYQPSLTASVFNLRGARPAKIGGTYLPGIRTLPSYPRARSSKRSSFKGFKLKLPKFNMKSKRRL